MRRKLQIKLKSSFASGYRPVIWVAAVTVLLFSAFYSITSTKGYAASSCAIITSGTNLSYSALEACGYPSPNTTGVPAGTTLTSVGSINCTNTTINAVTTSGSVTIGNNCTISNSKIIGTVDIGTNVTNVKLINDEISGPYTGSSGSPTCTYTSTSGHDYDIHALGNPANVTVDHSYLHCAAEAFNGNGIIKDSYIISDECWGPCGGSNTTHNEAIYIAGGNSAGLSGSTIDHNTIINPWGQTAGIFGDDHAWGPIHNLTITNNFVVSASDHIDTGTSGDGNTNIVVKNNRLSFIYDADAPLGGQNPSSSVTDWCGNFSDSNPTLFYDVNGGTNGAACPGGTTTTGDVNNDGVVNGADVSVVIADFGKSTGQAAHVTEDTNSDGAINGADLSIVINNFAH